MIHMAVNTINASIIADSALFGKMESFTPQEHAGGKHAGMSGEQQSGSLLLQDQA